MSDEIANILLLNTSKQAFGVNNSLPHLIAATH